MANRADLLSEVDTTLDGSGVYVGPWLDSAGILRVRVLAQFTGTPGSPYIEESSDQTSVFTGTGVSASTGTEVAITARYFRLGVSGGAANGTFRAVVRTVG